MKKRSESDMSEKDIKKKMLLMQKKEITEYHIYKKLSKIEKDEKNKKVLNAISDDELKHYNFWKKHTGQEISPDKFAILKYFLISRIFGLTFGIKLMEKGEKGAQKEYKEISKKIKGIKAIEKDEEKHEKSLINMINEERLEYVGSLVLGINDALVELTGALAGLTFALNKTSIIAFTGLITGISAALSMAASEYLSKRAEDSKKNPITASIYTGMVYLITVLLLISPYFIFKNVYFALLTTLCVVIFVIAIFQFYISVAKEVSFKKRFIEMATISMGVAAFTFLIGFLIKIFFNVQI